MREVVTTKTKCKPNGRSSDFITPNFIRGCLGGCSKTYCYTHRYMPVGNFDVSRNTTDILTNILEYSQSLPWPKVPNQVHESLYLGDIGCHTDIPLMQKHLDLPLQSLIDWFTVHSKIGLTFATKYPSRLDARGRGNRVRISLMPEYMRAMMEPGTDNIDVRCAQYKHLVDLGWEVHLNFSPVIVDNYWEEAYKNLFRKLEKLNIDTKCEVIFLTHSERKHKDNLERDFIHENKLWDPSKQEKKVTQHGGVDAVRYKADLKREYVETFKEIYSEFFNPDNIRYIF